MFAWKRVGGCVQVKMKADDIYNYMKINAYGNMERDSRGKWKLCTEQLGLELVGGQNEEKNSRNVWRWERLGWKYRCGVKEMKNYSQEKKK